MFSRYYLCAAALLAVSLRAQDAATATIRGRLSMAGESLPNEYVIELTNLANRLSVTRIEVSFSGDFTARNLPFGDYLARVTTYHGETVAQQIVPINQSTTPVELRVPPRPAAPTGATVSFRELRNPPRRKAVDAARAAQRFSEAGNYSRAAAELEKAVQISPEYAIAHSNLGVQYLRLGRHAEAEEQIRRAIEIAGPNYQDLANLAFAQLALEQPDQAVSTARRALQLRKDGAQAHLMLGLALLRSAESQREGLAHLEEAATTLESARRTLAALGRR